MVRELFFTYPKEKMSSPTLNKTVYDILLMVVHATQVLEDDHAAAIVVTSAADIISLRFKISYEEVDEVLAQLKIERTYPAKTSKIGNCGYPCDGYCQECDPFYGKECYDGNDEI